MVYISPWIDPFSTFVHLDFLTFDQISMGNASMHTTTTTQLTPAKALEIAKNCEDGSVPASVTAVLERAISELWQRIQAQPTTYVMNKEEFIVFNYYRGRFANVAAAQQAVARFWNNFQGDTAEIDGGHAS
ncbi:MAG: hypothetical protein LQ346_002576 [Caloplaca aetnensis]|nr:MAG: hypothetical protein LQ346_002576 [Caloplaca aetnensis]